MILLQILDEGAITDSQGRKVDFKVRITKHTYFTLGAH
jgi:ATP-dependent Clp protease ATP-binding subunit ClpA